MSTYLLRVEAVNLSNFVDDTDDLSTVRGGSLLLLNAVDKVEQVLKSELDSNAKPRLISRGASVGLFEITLEHDEAAATVAEEVERHLRSDDVYRHATFAVAVERVRDDFPLADEAVVAMSRWRQFRQPTVVDYQAAGGTSPSAPTECKYDRIRPATCALKREKARGEEGGEHHVSEATSVRCKAGMRLKKRFYDEGHPNQDWGDFVTNLSELSHDPSKGKLSDKMAVFYVDGNKFGAIQRAAIKSADDLKRFDDMVRGRRKAFLSHILSQMDDSPADWFYLPPDGKPRRRIETLLWGGDEFRMVVPAWCGWRLAAEFFRICETCETEDRKVAGHALCYSAGLVFCHHKAPIQRIARLTKDLANEAKTVAEKEAKQEGRDFYPNNLLAYHVLESFDYIGPDLKRARMAWVAKGDNDAQLVLRGSQLGNKMLRAATVLRELKKLIPRRKLFMLVAALRGRGPTVCIQRHGEDIVKGLIGEITAALGSQAESLQELHAVLGRDKTFWIHLCELWDYLGAHEYVANHPTR